MQTFVTNVVILIQTIIVSKIHNQIENTMLSTRVLRLKMAPRAAGQASVNDEFGGKHVNGSIVGIKYIR